MRPVSPATLADLADPAALDALPIEGIAGLRGELARLDSLLLGRLFAAGGNGNGNHERPERLLNVKQAAEKLGCAVDWLYRRTRTGKLPFVVRIGGKVRFSEHGIEAWIKRRSGR